MHVAGVQRPVLWLCSFRSWLLVGPRRFLRFLRAWMCVTTSTTFLNTRGVVERESSKFHGTRDTGLGRGPAGRGMPHARVRVRVRRVAAARARAPARHTAPRAHVETRARPRDTSQTSSRVQRCSAVWRANGGANNVGKNPKKQKIQRTPPAFLPCTHTSLLGAAARTRHAALGSFIGPPRHPITY